MLYHFVGVHLPELVIGCGLRLLPSCSTFTSTSTTPPRSFLDFPQYVKNILQYRISLKL